MLLFVLKQGLCKNISVGTPYIAPVVFPCLNGIGGEIMVVFAFGVNKVGNVDLIVIFRAVLDIAGIRAITTVIRLVGIVIGCVFIDGIALLKGFKESTGPELGIFIEAQLIH